MAKTGTDLSEVVLGFKWHEVVFTNDCCGPSHICAVGKAMCVSQCIQIEVCAASFVTGALSSVFGVSRYHPGICD